MINPLMSIVVLLASVSSAPAGTAGEMLQACRLATGQTPIRASVPRLPFTDEQIAAERAKRRSPGIMTDDEKAMREANVDAIRRFGAQAIELQADDAYQLIQSGTCWGAIGLVAELVHYPAFNVCPAEKVTYAQYIDIFIEYVEKHAERREEPFVFVVFDAMRSSFPCRR